jgi:Bacterial PH domain
MINRSRAYQARNAVALTLGAVLAAIFAFGTFDSFVTRQPWWPPAIVAILSAGLAGVALVRLRSPYEVVITAEGFRVRREFRWSAYRWDDVRNIREEPRGWVRFDFIPGHEPRHWYGVTESATGVAVADAMFVNTTSLKTQELVKALEKARQQRP